MIKKKFNLKSEFDKYFFKIDGEKRTLNQKNVLSTAGLLFLVIAGMTMSAPENGTQSYVKNSSTRIIPRGAKSTARKINNISSKRREGKTTSRMDSLLSPKKEARKQLHRSRQNTSARRYQTRKINYRAVQVIGRDEIALEGNIIPVGTNFIGKLLTAIDTKDQGQFVKVLLPYGGSYKGQGEIPKNSVLLGSIHYSGKGEKVLITFSKGVTPEGTEFDIQAQALSTKDYSTGIEGNHHGTAGLRVATALGLTMISGITSVLTSKEVIGTSEIVTPKSTLQNAMLNGVTKVADMEAGRQAGELAQENIEYVTIDAGIDLIVSLTQTFKGVSN